MTLPILIIATACVAYAATLLWLGLVIEPRRVPEPDLSLGETHR